jgi:hypothetical protein
MTAAGAADFFKTSNPVLCKAAFPSVVVGGCPGLVKDEFKNEEEEAVIELGNGFNHLLC